MDEFRVNGECNVCGVKTNEYSTYARGNKEYYEIYNPAIFIVASWNTEKKENNCMCLRCFSKRM
jgi:hypothetical protein